MALRRIRFAFFYSGVLAALLFLLPVWMPLRSLLLRRSPLVRPAGAFFRSLLPLIGIRVRLRGAGHLYDHGPALYLSNHQSQLDIALILGWIGPLAFLAKAELFRVPFFGSLLRRAHCLEVYRGEPHKNQNLGIRMRAVLAQGYSFCVFPEGTRSPNGEILPFKTGIFHHALEAQLPLVPVCLSGAHILWPKKRWGISGGEVQVEILAPIFYEEYRHLSAEQLRDEIRRRLIEKQKSIPGDA